MNDDNPNITAILEHYGATVPTRNGWAKMKCPFHNDSHASAAVNLQQNIFKCHGCQYKGSGYNIIMHFYFTSVSRDGTALQLRAQTTGR